MGKFKYFIKALRQAWRAPATPSDKVGWTSTPSIDPSWHPPPKSVPIDALEVAILMANPEDSIHVWGKIDFKVPLSNRSCKKYDDGQIIVTHERMMDLGNGDWLCRDCGIFRAPGSGRFVTVFEKLDSWSPYGGEDEDED